MKKLDKYIQKANFVKVYISDREGNPLKHFEGVIFSYSDDFVFMCDLVDFNYDGLVVLRKSDISEVRYSEHEMFFEKILKSENILRNIRLQKRENPFRVGTMKKMLEQLEALKLPVIFECMYGEEEKFLIGPILSINMDKIKIKYFNTMGEFDKKPVEIDFNEITFLRFDSPYANMFYKHTDKLIDYATNEPEEEMEVDEEIEETPQKDKKKKAKKVKKDKKVKKIKESSNKDNTQPDVVLVLEKENKVIKIKKEKEKSSDDTATTAKKIKKEDKKVKEKSKKSKKEKEDKKSKKDKGSKKEKKSKKDKKSKKSKDSKSKDNKAKSSKKDKKNGKKGKKSKKK